MSGWIPQAALMTPEPMDLPVLYEDDDLLIVDKPAGIVVHPAYRNLRGTLLNGILWRARSWPEGCRPSIVGRLDRLTSGLVVVAKHAGAHGALQRALALPDAVKEYVAVVVGAVAADRGAIDLPLRRDPSDRRRMIVAGDGSPSLTRYVVSGFSRTHCGFSRTHCGFSRTHCVSLLRCRLVTGRMHQIRVHLASRGWPIVGDPIYGPAPGAAPPFPRQALHASRVAFTHPVTHARLQIEAPLPDDIRGLLLEYGVDGMR